MSKRRDISVSRSRDAQIEFPGEGGGPPIAAGFNVQQTRVSVRRNAVQAVANATNVAIAFDTVDLGNQKNMLVPTSANITIREPGVYFANGWAQAAAHATGVRELYVVHVRGATPTTLAAVQVETNTVAAKQTTLHGSGWWECENDDIFQLYVHQTSGGNLNYTAFFQVYRLGQR